MLLSQYYLSLSRKPLGKLQQEMEDTIHQVDESNKSIKREDKTESFIESAHYIDVTSNDVVIDSKPSMNGSLLATSSSSTKKLILKKKSKYFHCYRHGKFIFLCGNIQKMFPFHYIVGPDWPCMLITYTLILCPSIFFLIYVGPHVHVILEILAIFTLIFTISFFSIIACSDPGIVFQSDLDNETNLTDDNIQVQDQENVLCARCQLRRPKDAMHCYDCDACIKQLDHHCPWTGKCIGRRTLKYFYGFLYCLGGHILIVVGTTLYYYFGKFT